MKSGQPGCPREDSPLGILLPLLLQESVLWTSLVVQWLKSCASNVGDVGLIPSLGTKIPHTMQRQDQIIIIFYPALFVDKASF